MARAQRLVAVVLRAELAAILRPQMAATDAQAMRSRRVTHKPAQVQFVCACVSDCFVLGMVVAFHAMLCFGMPFSCWFPLASCIKNNLFSALQMALQATVHLMGDGLGLAHAPQLAVAALSTERAAILRLRMAGRIVSAKQLRRATRKLVQVRLVGVNKLGSCCRCLSHSK